MAIETASSKYITNRDATPHVPNDLRMSGRNFERRAFIHVSVADVASIYKMFDLRSDAVVTSMKLTTSADMGTTTTFKIGLYNKGTTTVVAAGSDHFWGSAIVTNAGAVVKKELNFDATYTPSITVANAEKRLWEVLALASDPGVDFDVLMVTDGAADGAADVLLECTYKLV